MVKRGSPLKVERPTAQFLTGKWQPGIIDVGNGPGVGPSATAAQHRRGPATFGTSLSFKLIWDSAPETSVPNTTAVRVVPICTCLIESKLIAFGIGFAPDSVGTCQDSDGGDERHRSSPSVPALGLGA